MTADTFAHHGLKSPTCGGFRGPTSPQPPRRTQATQLKSPSIGGRGTRRSGSGGHAYRQRRGRGRVKTEKQTYFSHVIHLQVTH
jgi:hypothetical protein